MLRRRLTKHGYEMIVAEDGAKGVEAATREQPDLILMDLGLPVLSGWEAAQQLKQAAQTRAIPIIALSAHALEGERDKALAAGCDEFESKPVDLERLLEKLARLIPVGSGWYLRADFTESYLVRPKDATLPDPNDPGMPPPGSQEAARPHGRAAE